MIPAVKIEIVRAEGPTNLCRSASFEGPDCWQKANAWLRGQASTYPKTGGYDKHDFAVTWEDGEQYEGRLDCKHHECQDNDLDVAKHVRQFIGFVAGTTCPPRMSPSQYGEALDMLHKRGKSTREEFLKFLATYDVPAFGVQSLRDDTEAIRREWVANINANPEERAALEAAHGKVWDTQELSSDFEVIGFAAPFVIVRRKHDGKKGSLVFQHSPRFYYGFKEE